MATVAENLQTIKDSTEAIKQAIIDKGGTISGGLTTYADAIKNISGGEESGGGAFRVTNKLYGNAENYHSNESYLAHQYTFDGQLSEVAFAFVSYTPGLVYTDLLNTYNCLGFLYRSISIVSKEETDLFEEIAGGVRCMVRNARIYDANNGIEYDISISESGLLKVENIGNGRFPKDNIGIVVFFRGTDNTIDMDFVKLIMLGVD